MAVPGATKTVDLPALEGHYKIKYGPEIERAVPDEATLTKDFKFAEESTDGDKFRKPVHLVLPQGITWSRTGNDAVALNPAKAGQTKPSEIVGSQHALREIITFEAAAKAQGSEKAFGKVFGEVMLQMREAVGKFLEIDLMRGQRPMGVIQTGSSASPTIVITAASWASGLWAGLDGMNVIVAQALGSDGKPAGIRGAGAAQMKISSIDLDTRTITLTTNAPASTAAGDILLLGADDTVSGQTDYSGQYKVSSTTAWNSMVGLDKIANYAPPDANDLLFNIPGFTYSLWKPNTYDVLSGPLSFTSIQKGCAQMMRRGGKGDMKLLLSPTTWADLCTDQAALRRHGVQRDTFENGATGLVYHAQTGKVEIEASTFCVEGSAYMYQPKKFKRQGTTDVTFDLGKIGFPTPGGQMFHVLQNNLGLQYMCYSHQCLYTSKPGHLTLFKNIVNAA